MAHAQGEPCPSRGLTEATQGPRLAVSLTSLSHLKPVTFSARTGLVLGLTFTVVMR